MPDWFYRTVSRPLLFRLPATAARDLALGFMGALARFPGGGAVIDFLGHMRPAARLRRTVLGVTVSSPVGLAPRLDVHAVALGALARFGLGFLEVGPVLLRSQDANSKVERRVAEKAFWYAEPPPTLSADDLVRRLKRATRLLVPLIIRVGYSPGTTPDQAAAECRQIVEQLTPYATLFSLTPPGPALAEGWDLQQWRGYLTAALPTAGNGAASLPLLLCVPADLDDAALEKLIPPALAAGVGGILIDGSLPRLL